MEWGNFWSSHLPRTSYDIDLDCDSPNPNDQVLLTFFSLFLAFSNHMTTNSFLCASLVQGFEKMISGMYLGDIVRRVILRMSQESDIFGLGSSRLSMPFVLTYVLFLSRLFDEFMTFWPFYLKRIRWTMDFNCM